MNKVLDTPHTRIGISNRPEDRRIPDGSDFLDLFEVAELTPAELVRRMTSIGALAAARARKAERLRRPDAEVWSAIRASGFFYQFVPRSFGGLGGDLTGFIDAVLPLARGCPSTAWSACFCAGHNLTLAHFPAETQAELWGGDFPYIVAPMVGMPPGRAVPVDGGYRVTGSWSWASGIMDADWVFGMAMIADADPPRMMVVLFPAADAEVIDTWQVDGLEGSGSNDVRVDDIFVPTSRTLADVDQLFTGQTTEARRFAEPIFRAPIIAVAGFVASVSVLGAAQGALACFRDRLTQRVDKFSKAPMLENPLKLACLAEAELMMAAAESLIRANAAKVVAAASIEGDEQVRLRIEIRGQLAYAVKLCRDAVLRLAQSAGSSVHRREQPFQRYVRDIAVMASHVGFETDLAFELHGRMLAGLEPNTPMF